MTSFPLAPKLVSGGLVLIDPDTAAVLRVIALQYNPDTLTRTLQMQALARDGRPVARRCGSRGRRSRRSSSRRRSTPPTSWSFPSRTATPSSRASSRSSRRWRRSSIRPAAQLQREQLRWRSSGTLEIVPMEAPLTLFVWSTHRIVPVRITEFSITEEAFDSALNPIRAKVSLGLRVLTVNDLGFEHKGGSLFMRYQRRRRRSPPPRAGAMPARSASEGFDERRSAAELLAAAACSMRRPFPPNSRYSGHRHAADATRRTARPIVYLQRRFVPAAGTLRGAAASIVVVEGERLDNITARYLGDPEQFWRDLRREPRIDPRRADRGGRRRSCASRCPKACRVPHA